MTKVHQPGQFQQIERAFPAREVDLVVDLPPGRYDARWIEPETGRSVKREAFAHAGGRRTLRSPSFTTDIALKIAGAGR